MQKILVIGSGGAGKSTFSRKLGALLGLPVIHLDKLFWHPGWVETPREDWVKVIDLETSRSGWIMDGNYGGTMEMRLAACDTVIFLQFSRWICLRRVLLRSLKYRHSARPDMQEGCPENMDSEYLKFLHWIWTYPTAKTPDILAMLENLRPTKKVFIMKSPREVEAFLEKLKPIEGVLLPV